MADGKTKIQRENERLLREAEKNLSRYLSKKSKDTDFKFQTANDIKQTLLSLKNSDPNKNLNLVQASISAYKEFCEGNKNLNDREKYKKNIIRFLNEYEKYPEEFKKEADKFDQKETTEKTRPSGIKATGRKHFTNLRNLTSKMLSKGLKAPERRSESQPLPKGLKPTDRRRESDPLPSSDETKLKNIKNEFVKEEENLTKGLNELISLQASLKQSSQTESVKALQEFIDCCNKVVESSTAFLKTYNANNQQFTPDVTQQFENHLKNLAGLSRAGIKFDSLSHDLPNFVSNRFSKSRLNQLSLSGTNKLVQYQNLFERLEATSHHESNKDALNLITTTLNKIDLSFEYDKVATGSFEKLLDYLSSLDDNELKVFNINIKGKGLLNSPPDDSRESLKFILKEMREKQKLDPIYNKQIERVIHAFSEVTNDRKPSGPRR